jgi:hypothetical protein
MCLYKRIMQDTDNKKSTPESTSARLFAPTPVPTLEEFFTSTPTPVRE